MAGLAVQNFASAAVGMAIAMAVVRGLARRNTGELGNFWVDLVRGSIRILLPISIIAAVILIAGGAIQNFALHDQVVNTIAGAQQTIPGGPVASQEAIKELGTNGGGFFNANSAHPFENPTTWTNWVEIFLLLVISFSLPRTFGRMVGSRKQGYAIVAVMGVIATLSVSLMLLFQLQAHGTVPTALGASMEGVEQRFGVADSAVFADATTLTSTGAVDSFHDSYTSLGGLRTRSGRRVLLIGTSTIASILLGIWIGIRQGWRWGSRFDQGASGVTLVLYSMPEFWFGLLMIMLFSVTWSIFPSGGMETAASTLDRVSAHIADVLNHLALPFFVLTVSYLAEYSLIMRSSLMEVLGDDFILVARAKGVRERNVRRRHAVPNALLPVMTVTILSLGYVLGGAIVIETIFSWPGSGTADVHGDRQPGLRAAEGLFLVFSAAVIVANLVADLLYSYLDPRVRAA